MRIVDAVLRWVPMVYVVCALVLLYAFTQIDATVHKTLYSYGLQFNLDWATPYWNTAGILVAMGWTIVAVSGLFQAYLLLRKAPEASEVQQPELREENRWSTFRLGDGSTIKVKLVVKGAKRLNKYSSDGMPVYTVDTEPVVRVVDVPEALKVAASS